MGTMIHLSIGNLEIDWGKNSGFADHSPLFQINDLSEVPSWFVKDSDSIGQGDWTLYPDYNQGYSSPLWKIVDRLQLLGFTLKTAKDFYHYAESIDEIAEDEVSIAFIDLVRAFKQADPSILIDQSAKANRNLENEFTKIVGQYLPDVSRDHFSRMDVFDLDSPFGLPSYSILNILALNARAREFPVIWDFHHIVESGWAKRDEIVKPMDKNHKFLLVTEGSSDAKILKQAFSLLKSHISDFFEYVDMDEGYPFSGTGNLINFVKGLISIGIQNNIIVLFDNDAEGVASYNRCMKFKIPSNMRILKLPDLDDFLNFDTLGPNGKSINDINGRAAAIECYLDLQEKTPIVRWTNYNSIEEVYQGALIEKDYYKKQFLSQKEKLEHYNYDKIQSVLDLIITNCISMKEQSI